MHVICFSKDNAVCAGLNWSALEVRREICTPAVAQGHIGIRLTCCARLRRSSAAASSPSAQQHDRHQVHAHCFHYYKLCSNTRTNVCIISDLLKQTCKTKEPCVRVSIMFLKEVTSAHQGCIYLIKNMEKLQYCEILLQFNLFYFILISAVKPLIAFKIYTVYIYSVCLNTHTYSIYLYLYHLYYI